MGWRGQRGEGQRPRARESRGRSREAWFPESSLHCGFPLTAFTQNLLKPILGSYSRVVHREPSPAQRRGLGLPARDLGMRGPACLRSWCCPGTDRPPAVNIQ